MFRKVLASSRGTWPTILPSFATVDYCVLLDECEGHWGGKPERICLYICCVSVLVIEEQQL